MRYVISLPPYDPCSGGVRVLHYLATLLHGIGEEVATTHPCNFCPLLPVVGGAGPDDIAIYPDIEPGNPLEAPRVVRYMLYFASAHYVRHGGVRIPRSELVWVYLPQYLSDVSAHCEVPVSPHRILELPQIEPLWCYPEEKRIENLLFSGKRHCRELPTFPHTTIPSPDANPDRYVLRSSTLSLLRQAKNLYTLDHFTVLKAEALLCGCNVFKITGPDKWEPTSVTMENAYRVVMRPMEDSHYAETFVEQAEEFFNIG